MNTAATLTREQLRQRIDTLEALEGVMQAIDDVSGVEFGSAEQHLLDMQFRDHNPGKLSVAAVHALPQEVVLAGLQAMRAKLEAMQ
jgi:hypothetical protein